MMGRNWRNSFRKAGEAMQPVATPQPSPEPAPVSSPQSSPEPAPVSTPQPSPSSGELPSAGTKPSFVLGERISSRTKPSSTSSEFSTMELLERFAPYKGINDFMS